MLCEAIRKGDALEVRSLLKKHGLEPHWETLALAVHCGRPAVVRALLEWRSPHGSPLLTYKNLRKCLQRLQTCRGEHWAQIAHDLFTCWKQSSVINRLLLITMHDLYEVDYVYHPEVVWPVDRLQVVLQHLQPDNLRYLGYSCACWTDHIRHNFEQAYAPWRRWTCGRETWVQAVVGTLT